MSAGSIVGVQRERWMGASLQILEERNTNRCLFAFARSKRQHLHCKLSEREVHDGRRIRKNDEEGIFLQNLINVTLRTLFLPSDSNDIGLIFITN